MQEPTFFQRISFLMPPTERRLTLSTAITLVRLILVPFIVCAIMSGQWIRSLTLLSIAALSDVVDGALARYRQEQTVLGSVLDPIADKLLISSCFIALACTPSGVVTLPWWFIAVVVGKELLLVAGASCLMLTSASVKIQPTLLGKFTAFVQLCAIGVVLVGNCLCWAPAFGYTLILGMVMSMVLASFMQYGSIGYRYLTSLLVDY